MSVVIRHTQPDDFNGVLELLTELWPQKPLAKDSIRKAYDDGLATQTEIYLTATIEERMVGFASISLDNSLYHGGRLAWVEALVSDANVRGRGVGTALMNRVIEEAIQHHCKAVEIMIDAQAHAVKFVKNKGFQLRGNAFELKLTIPP